MEIVIDRPKGTVRTFRSHRGPIEVTYPLDYGYVRDVVNLQDGEEADVFVGTDPTGFHGRFMKGKTLSGEWEPDEFKWFVDCSKEEVAELKRFWNNQFPDLARDFVDFRNRLEVEVDMLRHMIPSHI